MKKLICMVLVVAMALSMGITSAFADNGVTLEVVQDPDSHAYPGEEVTVDVNITANTGIEGLRLPIKYSDNLELDAEACEDGTLVGWSVDANAVWYNPKQTDYKGTTGTILKLKFKVSSDAEAGDTAKVWIDTTDKNICEAYSYASGTRTEVTITATGATAADNVTIEATPTLTTISREDLVAASASDYLRTTVTMGGEINMNYRLYKTNYTDKATALNDAVNTGIQEGRIELLVWKAEKAKTFTSADEYAYGTESYKIDFADTTYGYYVTRGEGIPAKEMKDTLRVRLVAINYDEDGKVFYTYGPLSDDNPVSYCDKAIASSSNAYLVALCKTIEQYCSDAINYTKYTTIVVNMPADN